MADCSVDPRLQPAPETQLHELEARVESASRDGSATAHDIVEWRQECLALTQIACHDDLFQLGRACCNLARAYLAAGMASSAVSHAERAESLLLASAARTEAADLLPTALLVLADSLAARTSSLSGGARARVPSAKKENRGDAAGTRRASAGGPVRPLAPHTRPPRNTETRNGAGAAADLGGPTARKEKANAAALYKHAAEAYHRALLAAHEVFGKGHVECCPVLRGWARMAIERSSDFGRRGQHLTAPPAPYPSL